MNFKDEFVSEADYRDFCITYEQWLDSVNAAAEPKLFMTNIYNPEYDQDLKQLFLTVNQNYDL